MHKTVSAKQNMCNGNDNSMKKGEFGSHKVTHDMSVNTNVCDKKLIAHLKKSNCKYDQQYEHHILHRQLDLIKTSYTRSFPPLFDTCQLSTLCKFKLFKNGCS